MKKLTVKQQMKLDLMRAYIADENKTEFFTDDNISVGDQNVTYCATVQAIWQTGIDIKIQGLDCINFKPKRDHLEPTQLNELYRACLRQDEDFKKFVDRHNLLTEELYKTTLGRVKKVMVCDRLIFVNKLEFTDSLYFEFGAYNPNTKQTQAATLNMGTKQLEFRLHPLSGEF